MLTALVGNKIGMTQLFDDKARVVPVTVIDVSNWFVTQVKVAQKDQYSALQVGRLRPRYFAETFSVEWLKNKAKYFAVLRELPLAASDEGKYQLGQMISLADFELAQGTKVAVEGISIGRGFAGPVKRHGFAGGPKSHGSKFHRRTGAMSHMRTQGEVIKGKRLGGHMGNVKVTVLGSEIVRLDAQAGHIYIKGATPGKKDGFLVIRKQG